VRELAIDAFLSYSHLDRGFAVRLHQALLDAGKDVWLDEEDILPASKWAKDLKDAIESADTFVVVISPDWAVSAECRKELEHAATLDKRIIPLNLRATALEQLPDALRAQQFVPSRGAFEDDFEASVRQLTVAIETDSEWVRAHTGWAKKAFEWEEHGRDRSFLLSGSGLAAAELYLASATGKHPEPGERQSSFVLASRQGATLRQRRLLGGVSVALVVALILGGLALIQWRQAVANQHTAQSRQIAAESETALNSDPELSTLLALQALKVHPTAQARAALRDALPQLQVLRTLPGATTMEAATFSPNGKEVLTADLDGNVGLWNASTGRRLLTRRDPEGRSIVTVDFNATGTEFLTASLDGTYGAVTLWNASTDRPVRQLAQPGDDSADSASVNPELNQAAFSPDGREVVTAGGDAARVWSVATGQVLQTLQPAGHVVVSDATFGPDGTDIVITAGASAQVWNLGTGQQQLAVTEPGGARLTTTAFSPDGSQLVTAGADGTARVWSATTGAPLQVLVESGGALNGASFGPDGSEIVTASDNGTATTWNVRTGAKLLVLRGHRGPVFAASFSRNGTKVVTASEDGTAKVWDALPVGTEGVLTDPAGAPFYDVAANREGTQIVAVTGTGAADQWDTRRGHLVHRLVVSNGGWINGVDFSPDRTELVTAGEKDGAVRVWSAVTGHQRLVLRDPSSAAMYTATFSPNGKEILTASGDGTARIWSATTGEELRRITEPRSGGLGVVFSASFSPNGREVVTSSLDGATRIWSATTGTQLRVMTEPDLAAVITAAFNRSGSEVVTSSADGSARIWSAASGRQLHVLSEPGGASIYSAAFNRSGSEVVTSSADGSARIWSAASGDQLTVFTTGFEVRDSVFSPDGSAVVSTTFGGTAVIWSTELARSLDTLERIAGERVTRHLTAAERRAYL
jgi:WD40 repeat protein